jgi:hypothetical protein
VDDFSNNGYKRDETRQDAEEDYSKFLDDENNNQHAAEGTQQV